MKNHTLTIAVISLIAVAIVANPTPLRAQSTNLEKSVPEKKESARGGKKAGAIPFRGKVVAVDKQARTFKSGERIFTVTSETRLARNGKPVLLEDVGAGEEVRGNYKIGEGGKLEVQTAHFGPKSDAESKGAAVKEKVGGE